MAKRLLGTSVIGGQRFKVYEGTDKDCPELAGGHGHCDTAKNEIWINSKDCRESRIDTWFHEHLHAIITAYGIDHVLCNRIGITEERWYDFEEDLIRLLVPALRMTFKMQDPKLR